jgi:hypothetical protein
MSEDADQHMNTLRGLQFIGKVANPAKIQVVGDTTV